MMKMKAVSKNLLFHNCSFSTKCKSSSKSLSKSKNLNYRKITKHLRLKNHFYSKFRSTKLISNIRDNSYFNHLRHNNSYFQRVQDQFQLYLNNNSSLILPIFSKMVTKNFLCSFLLPHSNSNSSSSSSSSSNNSSNNCNNNKINS